MSEDPKDDPQYDGTGDGNDGPQNLREHVESQGVDLPDAAEESDTDYNGLLSHASEWHAFTNGLYAGLTTHPLRKPPVPEEGTQARYDYDREPHYYKGGYILGTGLQILGLGWAVYAYGPEALGMFLAVL